MLAIICISINVLTVIALIIIRAINNKRQAKIMKEYEQMQKRINEVHDMRLRVVEIFGAHAYSMLPDFETMIEDGKELKAGNYLNADRVVESLNLNVMAPKKKDHMTYEQIEALETSRAYKLRLFEKYGYKLKRGRKKSDTDSDTLKYIKQWYLTQTVEKMAEVLNITVYTVKRHLSEQKLQGIYQDKRLKEHKLPVPKPEKPDLNKNVKIVKLKSYEGMRLVDLGYNRMSFYVPENATASEISKLRQEKLKKMGVNVKKTG